MDTAVVKQSNQLANRRAVKISRAALRVIFVVVLIEWITMWVLQSSKIYEKSWETHLTAKLNSTYFGPQGTNLWLFTFPMMLIATLSCIYLHLGKASETEISSNESSNSNHHRLPSSMKRPVFVKAPLGIVNAMELIFSAMFIVLLIWSFASYNILYPPSKRNAALKVGLEAYILGCLGNICLAFMFFPVTRGSSILALVGLTSECSIKYHIWLGHASMVFFSLHSLGFIIYYAMVNRMSKLLEWRRDSISNVAGEITFVFCLLMWGTSFPCVRRKMFELFFYTHQLYALYIFFFVLHVGIPYSCMILPGIFLFLIDRYLRFLQSWHKVQLLSAHLLPCEALELNLVKSPGMRYMPMSIVFINVPSISKLEWHPFTVTSNCDLEPDRLSIFIKCEGNWSRALYKALSLPSPADQLHVSVEGPYGPTSLSFTRYDSLVMVSGGSGITALVPIIKEIFLRSTGNSNNYRTKQVLLICAFKKIAELSMLDLLLPSDQSGSSLDISKLQLKIEAYVTREEQQPSSTDEDKAKKPFRTVWFKPDANNSTVPLTAPLGPNYWLWLGAIISSSFLMFLLLLAILTRYYIYPIDHNKDRIYHFSARALWNMFFICLCVIITTSFAFMWNKKKALMEGLKEMQNMGVYLEPATSFSKSFWKSDGEELESQQQQLLAQATKVHFGVRPNLRKILGNCKGSKVGVVVCGPREMRHEVAKICSDGSTKNLHFEAISFNW